MLLLYKDCSDANHIQDAKDCLAKLYEETKRNQSAAKSYIARSYERFNPSVRF